MWPFPDCVSNPVPIIVLCEEIAETPLVPFNAHLQGFDTLQWSGLESSIIFGLLFIWSSHLEQSMTSISLISNTNEKPNIRALTCCSYIEIDFTIPGNKNKVSIFINIHNLLLLMELFIQGLAMTTLLLFLSRTLLFSMSSPKPFFQRLSHHVDP